MLLAILGSRLSLHVVSLRYIRLAKYCKYLIHFLAVVIVFNRQKNDFLANFYVCSPLPSNDKTFFLENAEPVSVPGSKLYLLS